MKNRIAVILNFFLFITITFSQETLEYQVTNNGISSYTFNGESNPDLILLKGSTYIFHVSAPGHPFWVKEVQSIGTDNAYYSGVTGNGTDQGDVTFVVMEDAPEQLFYNCEFHILMTGKLNIDSPVSIQDGERPLIFAVYQNYPNPFNPSTTINYDIPVTDRAKIVILDILGRKVVELLNTTLESGSYNIIWDGKNKNGIGMPSGVYFAKITTSEYTKTIKMILMQ